MRALAVITLAALALLAAPLASAQGAQDALRFGVPSGTGPFTVPITLSDAAGTPLGVDRPASERIQAFAITVRFSPAAAVSSATARPLRSPRRTDACLRDDGDGPGNDHVGRLVRRIGRRDSLHPASRRRRRRNPLALRDARPRGDGEREPRCAHDDALEPGRDPQRERRRSNSRSRPRR